MRMSAVSGAKNYRFFEIYGVSTRTGWERTLSQCGRFADKGGGEVNFSRFCANANVLYGRPLRVDVKPYSIFTRTAIKKVVILTVVIDIPNSFSFSTVYDNK